MSTLPPSELPHRNLPAFFQFLYWRQLVLVQRHHLTDGLLSVSDCYCHAEAHTNPSGFNTSLTVQLIISKFIFLRTEVSIFDFHLPYA